MPREYQHRVLFYGVIGALIFRGIFLAAGVAIVSQFTAMLFVFGAILIYSAIKLLKDDDDSIDPGKSFAVRLLRKLVPVSDEYRGTKFFYKEAGKRIATPLLAVVVAIEAADLVFAVDSVPAVLAVSDNTFIIYASNAFAILGLRALYFLLAGMLKKFHYLGKGLAFILAFIGVKLFLQAGHKVISTSIPEIPSLVSLGVIVLALTISIVASLRNPLPPEDDENAEIAGGADVVDGQIAADARDAGDAVVDGDRTDRAPVAAGDPGQVAEPDRRGATVFGGAPLTPYGRSGRSRTFRSRPGPAPAARGSACQRSGYLGARGGGRTGAQAPCRDIREPTTTPAMDNREIA